MVESGDLWNGMLRRDNGCFSVRAKNCAALSSK